MADHRSTPDAAGAPVPAWQIAVGDELLAGSTSDTNSREVQRALADYGVDFRRITVIPDTPEAIADALTATGKDGLVVLTGGLGSTPDDLTRESVAEWAGVRLRADPGIADQLERRCRERSFPYSEAVARQALVPEGMTALPNPAGSAPALAGRLAERLVVMLPGVPGELRALLPVVRDWLERDGHLPGRRPHLLLRTAQMAELALARLCRPWQRAHPDLRWAYRLTRWGVDVRVETAGQPHDPAPLLEIGGPLRAELGLAVYADTPQELNELVQELMVARGSSLSVAESCTAGLLGARLTELAGSSTFFKGGVLVYADDIKRDLLGVPQQILDRHGAVSGPTAEAMAVNCRQRLQTDYAVAITGIAGPDGGSDLKPVGTTWIGIAAPGHVHVRQYRFPGDRNRNRRLAVAAALDGLRRLLQASAADAPWLASDTWGVNT